MSTIYFDDDAYQDYLDEKREAMYDYGPEPTEECPECGEMTLCVGETQHFYEYAGGPEVCPPETKLFCNNCEYEDVI